MQKKIYDYWFFIPILILASYFIFRLINQSQMMWIFPTDAFANDFAGHIAKLQMLGKHGLFSLAPEWYNGQYIILKAYPPGWYLFALPFLALFNDPSIAGYFSLLAMYVFGFLFILLIGKFANLSLTKRIAFFFFFFANPLAIGYFMRLGKMPEMLAWVFVLLLFALMVAYFKKNKLDLKFILLFVPIYLLVFYSHTFVFISSSILIGGFFFSRKKFGDRIIFIVCLILVVLISSTFWYPAMKISDESNRYSISNPHGFEAMRWLVSEGNLTDKLVSFVLPPIFWILSFFYLKRRREDLAFFSIPLLFSVLLFTRLLVFIPIFNRPAPDTYNLIFILLIIYLFLKLTPEDLPKKVYKLFPFLILGFTILGVIISFMFTPLLSENSQTVKETFALLDQAEDSIFISAGSTSEAHPGALVSYIALHTDLVTPQGWDEGAISSEFEHLATRVEFHLKNNNPELVDQALRDVDTKYVLSYAHYCDVLKESKLVEVESLSRACLYRLES